jgi:hypothetical protein
MIIPLALGESALSPFILHILENEKMSRKGGANYYPKHGYAFLALAREVLRKRNTGESAWAKFI